MMRRLCPLVCCLLLPVSTTFGESPLGLKQDSLNGPADFPLVMNRQAARILVDTNDAEVVRVAGGLLAGDIERVAGVKPEVEAARRDSAGPVVVLGTIGKSALVNDLVKRGKLDVSGIAGKWESFVIQIVPAPYANAPSALVIVGSDRRGAAYGALTVSEIIGVSPWVWWADVPAQRRRDLVLSGSLTEGPPSVKYRGIFINDEDWGLHPWAAKTFEPKTRDIGPKTYAKVCELLLRLKANYLWPAMHACTRAFNTYSENKLVADRYGIVMGSSHCEQMLRNNVSEWPKNQKDAWDPVTNLPAILEYWEQRIRENGRFENVFTVGMRGIHDSAMPGGGTITEKRDRLANVIELQRGILARNINPDAAQVPQIFCPYKEVLDIYQAGLKLPDDVTIVWPDDNYGYIRRSPNEAERKRSGGSGIYYHLSYLGRPHDYLWLDSTPPSLIWHEMTKAYELGARQLWVANVGDIKSIETGMSLFLDVAWNIRRYGPDVQRKFLRDFSAAQFGAQYADNIAAMRDEYYRLCAIRRPEHFGFNRTYPATPVQNSDWSHAPENDEAQRLLDRWLALAGQAEATADGLPTESHDAYFQLVQYPACAGAAMAEKMILAEKARRSGSTNLAQRAEAAHQRIRQLTERYNSQNGGKWRGIMSANPVRRRVFDMPPTTASQTKGMAAAPEPAGQIIAIDPMKFVAQDRDGAGWRVIEGLGPRGRALAVLPHKDTPTLRLPQEIRNHAPVADFDVQIPQAGEVEVRIEALPTHPFTPRHTIAVAVSINDGDPVLVRFEQGEDDENDKTWQANVLRSAMTGRVMLHSPEGRNALKLWAADPGVVVQHIALKSRITR